MKYKFLTVFAAGLVLSLPPIAEKITQALEQSNLAQADQTVMESRRTEAVNKRETYRQQVEEKRAELLEKLDDRRSQAIENRCNAAQNILSNVAERAEQSYLKHQELVDGMTNRLESLLERLNANHPDVDTSSLESAVSDFKTESAEFLADFEVYVGAVQESAELENCQDDPENFHLALETAKNLRAELRGQQKNLKQSLIDGVKSAVQTIRQDFVEQQSQNSNEEELGDPDQPVSNEENTEETQ